MLLNSVIALFPHSSVVMHPGFQSPAHAAHFDRVALAIRRPLLLHNQECIISIRSIDFSCVPLRLCFRPGVFVEFPLFCLSSTLYPGLIRIANLL